MSQREVVVVGAGASSVHFAETALERGWSVTMLDVGHQKPEAILPDSDLDGLKRDLDDPVSYFLGDDYGSLILPSNEDEFYGFPPSKAYVFEGVDHTRSRAEGFNPLLSFAAGGLAEAWTGGSYPLNSGELEAWPIDLGDLAPFYDRVAERIGISGRDDDLAQFFPSHAELQSPLDLDEHARALVARYEKKRRVINGKLGCWLGHARLAVLSKELAGRPACDYLGRCLWGCPQNSLYVPSITLEKLRAHPGFTYVPDVVVSHFDVDDGGRVQRVVARSESSGLERSFAVTRLALGAGALASAHILLTSWRRAGGTAPVLDGLMDNRQVLMPFVNLGMVARQFEAKSYQYHQLALGLEGATPFDYVHALVTTLKTALIHPLVQSLPFDLVTSLRTFRDLHAALGLLNINFPDTRRAGNTLTLEDAEDGGAPRLAIRYQPDVSEAARLKRVVRRFRKILRVLGCLAPSKMTHVRPMGSSVHYAGAVPMANDGDELTSTVGGRARAFENLWLIDGLTFPSLPAKNLTFTLMANAVRIADREF